MKATLTIEVPSRGCHHGCPLCVTAHEPENYAVWYQEGQVQIGGNNNGIVF